MEKNTLSQYGWVIILILVLTILVTLATPFGNFIKDSVLSSTEGFIDITYEALNMDRPIRGGEECFLVDDMGDVIIKNQYKSDGIQHMYKALADSAGVSLENMVKAMEYQMFITEINKCEPNKYEEMNIENLKIITDKEMNKVSGEYMIVSQLGIATPEEAASFKQGLADYGVTIEQYGLAVLYEGLNDNMTTRLPDLTPETMNTVTEDQIVDMMRTLCEEESAGLQEALVDFDNDKELFFKSMLLEIAFSGPGNSIENAYGPNWKEKVKKMSYDDIKLTIEDYSTASFYVDIYKNLYYPLIFEEGRTKENLLSAASAMICYIPYEEFTKCFSKNPSLDYNLAFIAMPTWNVYDGCTADYIFRNIDKQIPNRAAIPESVNGNIATSIPKDFLQSSEIEMVYLPKFITDIGESAFYNCQKLTQINLKNVETLEYRAFYNTSLKRADLTSISGIIPQSCFENCTSLHDVIIGNGVTTIDYYAFQNCASLEYIEIPASVTTINSSAFYGCSPKLIIAGTPGSAAETYANENHIAFKPI